MRFGGCGFGPGRTDYLKSRFDAQLRPQPSVWIGYGRQPDHIPGELEEPFEPTLLVFRAVEGRRLGLESTSLLANAIRRTLMSRHRSSPPEWLSGHQADGMPSHTPRPAYLPLGFVGREHADGHLLGVAIALPARNFSSNDFQTLQALLSATVSLSMWQRPALVSFACAGVMATKHALNWTNVPSMNAARALNPVVWTQPSQCWTTVTPIVLPRFPRRVLTPADIIAQACEQAGYPKPVAVRYQYAPFLEGVPHARSFPSAVRKPGLPPRLRMHAQIRFPCLVRGPVMVGASRYLGFGFCRPTPPQSASEQPLSALDESL